MRMDERAVVARVERLTLRELRFWIREGWVRPAESDAGPVFDELDVARIRLDMREVREGRFLRVEGGTVVSERRFRPGRGYCESSYLPPVRAPREAVSCLERLATVAASASL